MDHDRPPSFFSRLVFEDPGEHVLIPGRWKLYQVLRR
jgi:hypothetical protein